MGYFSEIYTRIQRLPYLSDVCQLLKAMELLSKYFQRCWYIYWEHSPYSGTLAALRSKEV